MRKHPAHTGAKRAEEPVVFFITLCSKNRARIFDEESFHQVLLDAWREYPNNRVGRYVIMPDHIHFFCSPNYELDSRLKPWIKAVKAYATRNWKCRPEEKLWLSDFWDTQMRTQAHYLAKLDYVWENPVRAALVDDAESWPYKGSVHSLAWDS